MKKQTIIILLLLTFIGAALRIYQLSFQELNCDETFTLMVIKKPLLDLIYWTLFTDYTPPIFYILSHISYILSGYLDWAARIPSLIAGILSIPAMYLLGFNIRLDTQKTDGERVGLFCAVFMTILYPMIYYSQFARSYALMIFTSILFITMYIYIHRISYNKMNAPREYYYILGFLGALCIWVHLFAIIFVILVLILLSFNTKLRNAISAWITFVICSIPLIPLFINTITQRTPELSGQSLMWGMGFKDMLGYSAMEFFNLAFPIFFFLIIYGIYHNQKDKLIIEMIGLVFFTYIIGLILSTKTPVFPRYFYSTLPILLTISAVSYSDLLNRINKENVKWIFMIEFIILLILTQLNPIISQYTTLRLVC